MSELKDISFQIEKAHWMFSSVDKDKPTPMHCITKSQNNEVKGTSIHFWIENQWTEDQWPEKLWTPQSNTKS